MKITDAINIAGKSPTRTGLNVADMPELQRDIKRQLKRSRKVRKLLKTGGPSLGTFIMQGYRSSGAVALSSGSAYLFGSLGADATLSVQPGSVLVVHAVAGSVLAAGAQATGYASGVNIWVNGVALEGGQTIQMDGLFPGTQALCYHFPTGGTSLRVQLVGSSTDTVTGWAEVFPSFAAYVMKKAGALGSIIEIEAAADLFADDDDDDDDEI